MYMYVSVTTQKYSRYCCTSFRPFHSFFLFDSTVPLPSVHRRYAFVHLTVSGRLSGPPPPSIPSPSCPAAPLSAADFDPGSQSSRVKVEVSGNLLTVKVDPKNSKTWEDCAQVCILPVRTILVAVHVPQGCLCEGMRLRFGASIEVEEEARACVSAFRLLQ